MAIKDWRNAGIAANNLVELESTLGDIRGAIRDGERAILYADQSGNAFQRWVNRATKPMLCMERAGAPKLRRALAKPSRCWLRCSPKLRCCIRCAAFNIAISCWPRPNAPRGGSYLWGRTSVGIEPDTRLAVITPLSIHRDASDRSGLIITTRNVSERAARTLVGPSVAISPSRRSASATSPSPAPRSTRRSCAANHPLARM